MLLLSSLAPFIQSRIPVREWCPPQWAGLSFSVHKGKVIPPEACSEVHLLVDARLCKVDN